MNNVSQSAYWISRNSNGTFGLDCTDDDFDNMIDYHYYSLLNIIEADRTKHLESAILAIIYVIEHRL